MHRDICEPLDDDIENREVRIKLAIFPGFVTGFDDINANIRITLADINSATMYGLHQRIHKSGEHIEQLREQADKAELGQQELLTKNGELLTQNKSLERELEQLRVRADVRDKQEDDRRLQQFSDFLGVSLFALLELSCLINILLGPAKSSRDNGRRYKENPHAGVPGHNAEPEKSALHGLLAG